MVERILGCAYILTIAALAFTLWTREVPKERPFPRYCPHPLTLSYYIQCAHIHPDWTKRDI